MNIFEILTSHGIEYVVSYTAKGAWIIACEMFNDVVGVL